MGDAEWRIRALCRDMSADLFFPADNESLKEAKEVCFQCPVRRACLNEAMLQHEIWGVWGGLSERERRRLRSRRRVLVLKEAS